MDKLKPVNLPILPTVGSADAVVMSKTVLQDLVNAMNGWIDNYNRLVTALEQMARFTDERLLEQKTSIDTAHTDIANLSKIVKELYSDAHEA